MKALPVERFAQLNFVPPGSKPPPTETETKLLSLRLTDEDANGLKVHGQLVLMEIGGDGKWRMDAHDARHLAKFLHEFADACDNPNHPRRGR